MDNAWDAESLVVKVTLPDILSADPVIIEDDGHGMKNQEIRQEYLKIASPRFSRKGERTPILSRRDRNRPDTIGVAHQTVERKTMKRETARHQPDVRILAHDGIHPLRNTLDNLQTLETVPIIEGRPDRTTRRLLRNPLYDHPSQ